MWPRLQSHIWNCWAVSLVFQSTENYATVTRFCARSFGYVDGYYLTGLPDDLSDLFGQAYNAGARIHSNSWGSSVSGDYTSDSVTTDQFMWNNPDMLITFSSGNARVDANTNGVVDNDSIGSPATAKDVLAVGASENERPDNFACDTGLTYTSQDAYQSGETCTSMAGTRTNILGTVGARWGFTAVPLNSDLTAGNKEQMAPFSSRGPTDDGRIKPDVVAPGTWMRKTLRA
ncbi:MAG: S8 family serine peptidase [Chloroflexi bacterium]|nr:S8 family serine peptidase [Chloroflexota bacterium]